MGLVERLDLGGARRAQSTKKEFDDKDKCAHMGEAGVPFKVFVDNMLCKYTSGPGNAKSKALFGINRTMSNRPPK